jgi:multiple sugar transport system substrate-binding protein
MVLAACGPTPLPPTKPPVAATATPVPPTKAPEPVTLTIWGGWPEIQPVYEKAAAAYKKLHPNVTINILTHPLREFEQKLSATIPADTAADIIEASPYPMQKFLAAGLIPANPANVVEWMTKPGRLPQALVEDNKGADGKYYGLNYFQGRHVIYWNTDMFKEIGLPGAPKTMDELVQYAQKLAKRDAQGNLTVSGVSLRLSGGGSGVGEKFWMYLYPNGGSIIEKTKAGKWHNGYNNEAGRKTLQMYIDLVWKYKADDHKIKHDAEALQLKQTAMFVRESWVIGDIRKKAPDLKYDTSIMPKGVRWGDLATGVNIYVTRTCKNPQVAWDFILFLNSDENLRLLMDESGWLPQRLDADLKASLDKEPRYKSFLFSDPNYQIYTYPTLPEYDEILTKFSERLVKAFLDPSLVDNPTGIAKVLGDAAKETDDILKRNNHYGTD